MGNVRQELKSLKKYAQLSKQPEEKLQAILMEKTQQFKRKTARKKYLKRKVRK